VSIQRYETADGTRWRVRWREAGGRMRSRSVNGKREATALDADIRSRKFTGQALPRPGNETLAAAHDEWWRLRGSTLATNTQRTYQAAWNAHVRDRFDSHRISALAAEPQLFEELMADMRARGVGRAAQRKVLVVISAVLTSAVEWRKLPANPVWGLRKPPSTRERHARPFPPLLVERIRLQLLRRETKDSSSRRNLRDSSLVCILSYAGLRPGEALALRYGDIGQRTIAVDKAVSGGEEGPTKTGAVRSVPLVAPLHTDLEYLRSHCRAHEDDLVFPASGGGYWSRSDFNNWRNRVWKPVVRRLANADGLERLADTRPYDCRSSFVSLQLRAGASPLEVARWAGHSPAIMFKHYAPVIDELVGEPVISAEEQIFRARSAVAARDKEELDSLLADLFERPTLTSGGHLGAARLLYAPPEVP
jgi:integrase